MADVEEVVRLLESWRDATSIGRVGVAVDAARTIRGLSPRAKRELAAEVAERVAPQLVPQIRAEEGDLSPEQVAAVVDLLRRADRAQLDDLVTALRAGDVDTSLALVDEAVDTLAPTDPPPPPAAEPDGAHERPAAPVEEGADAARARAAVAAATAEAAIDEEAVRAAAEEAAAARAERWRDTSASRDRPAYELPEVSFDIDLGEVELPDPTVETVAPLAERRHELPGSATASGPVAPADRSSPAPLAGPPTPAVVAAVTATPDGYRRRRAALAALRADRLDATEDVVAIVRSFGRASDRAWVAGAALDAGLLGVGQLAGLGLGPGAVRRLRNRAG